MIRPDISSGNHDNHDEWMGVIMKIASIARLGAAVLLGSTGIALVSVATTSMALASATSCVGNTCTSVDGSGFSVTGSRTWFRQPCGPFIQAHEWDDNGTFNEYSRRVYIGSRCLLSSPGFNFGGFNAETDTWFHGDFFNGDFWVGSQTTSIYIYGVHPKRTAGNPQGSHQVGSAATS